MTINYRTDEYRAKNAEYRASRRDRIRELDRANHRAAPWKATYHRLKVRAKKNCIPFNLTKEYLESIWTDTCPVFGIPLEVNSTPGANDNNPNVDRIVPELGYVVGNVQIISGKANRMKNDGSLADLERLVEFMQQQRTQQPC